MNFSATSGNVTRCAMIGVALLITAHRLPAPVQEEPDAIPQPSATIAPKIKFPGRAATKRNDSKPTAAPAHSRFAGTWTGTMQTFPAGDQSAIIIIDANQTTMTIDWFGKHASAKAEIEGDTVRATFPPPPMQPETHKWAVTPLSDGKTARVRFRCFMNDFTAVFQRAGQ